MDNNKIIKGRLMFLVNRTQEIGHSAQEHYLSCEACVTISHCQEMEEFSREHYEALIKIEELENLQEISKS